ncbi:MAG: bifunctional pyr operon transcriptional regulator/uracil phosphoribosyltransferase, partial [Candidatus Aminicenantes bacterium]|nr:bifunctional pyr operon transcriptional regulator/uracil phosphoribosyltransferase [Candidatus Aminicenantes bacterium]
YKPSKGTLILDEKKIRTGLLRIADQIVKTKELDNLVFLGIEKEGKVIAKRLSLLIKEKKDVHIPVAGLDINPYRDDRSIIDDYEDSQTTIPFSVDNKIIMLIDDLISTGRTARSALDAIIDKKIGRPKKIEFIVIINVENLR